VEQRLARFLLDEAQGGSEVQLKTTKGNLASQLGMSQESLSRKLASFQDRGLIDLKAPRIIRLTDKRGWKRWWTGKIEGGPVIGNSSQLALPAAVLHSTTVALS
jgi:DNA-binding transcriptional ArsR family regulator